MTEPQFYERQMVQRIAEIFGNPKPPAIVTEVQFDMCWSAPILEDILK